MVSYKSMLYFLYAFTTIYLTKKMLSTKIFCECVPYIIIWREKNICIHHTRPCSVCALVWWMFCCVLTCIPHTPCPKIILTVCTHSSSLLNTQYKQCWQHSYTHVCIIGLSWHVLTEWGHHFIVFEFFILYAFLIIFHVQSVEHFSYFHQDFAPYSYFSSTPRLYVGTYIRVYGRMYDLVICSDFSIL